MPIFSYKGSGSIVQSSVGFSHRPMEAFALFKGCGVLQDA